MKKSRWKPSQVSWHPLVVDAHEAWLKKEALRIKCLENGDVIPSEQLLNACNAYDKWQAKLAKLVL